MSDPCQDLHNQWQVEEFRKLYPSLRISHMSGCGLTFCGNLTFKAKVDGLEKITDTYSIRCEIKEDFPTSLPMFFETEGRIPKSYHTNHDGTLCLGSPLRVRQELHKKSTLHTLIKDLLIPYLYKHSYHEKHGDQPLGELEHGALGLIEDYETLFEVKGAKACYEMLLLLGMEKLYANKKPCPCGSGARLGKCHNQVLNPFRKIESRQFYLKQAELFKDQYAIHIQSQ